MLTMIDDIKVKSGLAHRTICAAVQVPYSSCMRWRGRRRRQHPLMVQPGPKKTVPIDLAVLKNTVAKLDHGRHRSFGSGELYRQHAESISRRDFGSLLESARADVRNSQCTLQWMTPGLVWAFDPTELEVGGRRFFFTQAQDLASRYKMPPLMTRSDPLGSQIAAHLQNCVDLVGDAALFGKRDNGGNCNEEAIDLFYVRHAMIPLNSPPWCAPYNGAVEHAQGELKNAIREILGPILQTASDEEIVLAARVATHDLNHLKRPSLNGRIACDVFNNRPRRTYTLSQRRDAYEWLVDTQNGILKASVREGRRLSPQTAWRVACRMWLVNNGHLVISKPEVSTNYASKKVS